jgi:hypothetical protein
MMLESRDVPPPIVVVFVKPIRDSAGDNIFGGEECDSHTAKCGEKLFTRSESETLIEFKARVHDAMPVGGPPSFIIFEPDEPKAREQ